MFNEKRTKLLSGFTIAELMVVIIIVGILASVSIISYGSYRKSITAAQIKSDLNSVATAMEGARMFNNTYPTNVPSAFTASPNITVTGGSTDGKTYCVDAVSSDDTSLYYYITSTSTTQGAQQGTCATSHAPSTVPVVSLMLNGANVQATTSAITCTSSTPQYSFSSRTNDGTWSAYSAWSTSLIVIQAATEGTKYGYKSQARCYVNDTTYSQSTSSTEAVYQNPVNASSAPVVTVALNTGNVIATITPATCTLGTVQYGLSSRTNDGTWSAYSAWSTSLTASQTATEGVKYGYQAQARCYVSDTLFSISTVGVEGTYIQPIATVPTVPTASWTSNIWPNTVFAWTTPVCPSGMTANYRYDYTDTGGYHSGWQLISGNSVSFSTSTNAYTYSFFVQARCTTTYANGNWTTSATTSYSRSNSAVAWAIGGGSNAAASNAGDGGGGGGYSSKTIVLPSGSYSVAVGGAGGDSYFVNTGTLLAKGGGVRAGGNSGSGVGDVKYSGGDGGVHYNASDWGGGGGGGAAGPDGPGIAGASSPSNGRGGAGGNGDNNSGGAGGALGAGRNSTGWAGAGNAKGGGGGAGIWNNGYGGAGGYPGGGGGGGNVGGNIGAGAGAAGQVQIYYPTGSMSGTGGTITTSGGYTYHTFTGSGTFQVF